MNKFDVGDMVEVVDVGEYHGLVGRIVGNHHWKVGGKPLGWMVQHYDSEHAQRAEKCPYLEPSIKHWQPFGFSIQVKEPPATGETDVANYEKYTGIIRSNVGALNELNGRMTEQDTRVDKLEANIVDLETAVRRVWNSITSANGRIEAIKEDIRSLECCDTDRLLQANKLTMRLMDVEEDNVNNIAVIAKLIDEAEARDKRIDDLTERVKGKAGRTEATEDRPCENCKDCDMPPGQEPCKECLAHPSRYALDKTWTHPNWRPQQ